MSATPQYTASFTTTLPGSIKMISMQEALARERMYESRRYASMARVASQMAAAKRWRRLERIARSAHQRHAASAADAASVVDWD